MWGSPMSGYRNPRYVKASCNFDVSSAPSAACSESWSNLGHNSDKTTGTHGSARGLNLKLSDCQSHQLVSLNYAGKAAGFQSCGHHCQDASCHQNEGCNQ